MLASPSLRLLAGRWSRMSLAAPVTAAAIDLMLRGRNISVVLIVSIGAVTVLDLAVLLCFPRCRVHQHHRVGTPPARWLPPRPWPSTTRPASLAWPPHLIPLFAPSCEFHDHSFFGEYCFHFSPS